MRYFLLAVLVIMSLTLQSTIFSELQFFKAKPDLLLIIVIFFSLFEGKQRGAIIGFTFGLVEDLLLGRYIGINALSKMVIGYLIGALEGKVYKENLFAPGFAVIVGTIVNTVLVLILFNLTGAGFHIGSQFASTILPMTLYNLIIGLIVYSKFYKALSGGI